MTPRISVVLPTHNRPELLCEALASIAAQEIDAREVIVVDDASEPPVDIDALRARFGPSVRGVRHQTARGGAAAKNSGIRAASAPVFSFLDDDDLYGPAYLQRALAVLDEHADLDVVFMGVSHFGSRADWAENAYQKAMAVTLGASPGVEAAPALLRFGPSLFPALLRSVPMAFQRPVVRRNALSAIGEYRDSCLLWDCDWALRAALHGRTALLNEQHYRQRADGQGSSSRGDRTLDHLLSEAETKDRLLTQIHRGGDATFLAETRRAAAEVWFTLAYHYSRTGQRRKALSAWATSQRRKFSLRRYRLLGRLALGTALGLDRRRWTSL